MGWFDEFINEQIEDAGDFFTEDIGKYIGGVGIATAGLWEWILTSTQETLPTTNGSEHSPSSEQPSDRVFMETVNKRLAQQLAQQSLLWDRRSQWLVEQTSTQSK